MEEKILVRRGLCKDVRTVNGRPNRTSAHQGGFLGRVATGGGSVERQKSGGGAGVVTAQQLEERDQSGKC